MVPKRKQKVAIGGLQSEKRLVEALHTRPGESRSYLDVHAVTFMAASWFLTPPTSPIEGRASLLECFDEAVATYTRELAEAQLDPSRHRPR